MNYNQVIDFMYNSLPMYQRVGKAAYKADLENIIELDNHFGNPHKNFRSIHIAGTNGKGSVSHSLASVLQESGYKVGLYTSPHLVDYRERIRINGDMISKDFVCDFINNNIEILKKLTPSFFEMSVALAFDYFSKMNVDVAIIEVGMGGRLDSTNIITPDLSVITNIGLDHTQFLGDTIEKIAIEKAGIIKSGVPVIVGETQSETQNVFKSIASERNTEILFADQQLEIVSHTGFSYKLKSGSNNYNISFDLKGKYQKKNLLAILASIEKLNKLNYDIAPKSIENGLKTVTKNTGFRGRWEIINESPVAVCDTGHNKEGLAYTISQIRELKCKTVHFVLGFVNDKNIEDALSLFPSNAKYYFTKASVPRALNEEELCLAAKKHNLSGKTYPDVLSAYNEALKFSIPEDLIFVGGSTFIVGDLLGVLG